jgi:UPF0716 family protein affecting phage T7 exclusion
MPRSENPVRWEPLNPYADAKKDIYKRVVNVRAAIYLLAAAWFMKPSHFRPGSDSRYKNLGWGLPLIPGFTYAWDSTTFLGPSIKYHFSHLTPSIEDTIPHFSTLFLKIFFVESYILIAAFIYCGALFGFGCHWLMCGLAKIFGTRESPPPYEFFLVRSASGFMWLSVFISLMAVPVLAQTPDLIGRLTASALSVPLISLMWTTLMLVAALSSSGVYRAENRGIVRLKEMYESERFVKLVWRTQLTIGGLMVAGIIFLARHPDFLANLIISHR